MAETYCGKICAECARKEELNCPGCKMGPGRTFGGHCELASCARSKGHESCETCIFRGNCGMLRGRDQMMDTWTRKQQEAEARKARIAEKAPVLGKWLWLLFWLIIPSTIGGLMANESIASFAPGAYFAGQIVQGTVSCAYGYILLAMASQEERYRKAGIYMMIIAAVSVLVAFVTGDGVAPAWTLLFTGPAAVLGFMAEYNEYMGHGAVLNGVDNELSEKWEKLWKWHIGCFGGMIGSLLLIAMVPMLGLLVMMAAAIGVVVVSILKLIYLYRTAKIFRNFKA